MSTELVNACWGVQSNAQCRLRIEQERIPFAHAITEIRKAFL
ncbi:DUF2220 domain-containing protein [Corynebacterium sp. HMSC078C09]|nr:DUF2220 domain-containing protein [Corynebacterium sp. HMSC078C09]